MKITYDPYADAMYIYTNGKKKVAETVEARPDFLIDIGAKDELLGIEVLSVSEKMPKKELKSVNLELNLETPKRFLPSR